MEFATPDAPQSLLRRRVDSVVRENPHYFSDQLALEAEEGTVILRGKVRSFYQKQMAQETLRRVEGVFRIDNRLEVGAE